MERALQALHGAQDIEDVFGDRSHITDEGEVVRTDVGCPVDSLTYDFRRRAGRLNMPEGCNCDMAGAIYLFRAIDKNVRRIETFSGGQPDTSYSLTGDDWKAWSPAR